MCVFDVCRMLYDNLSVNDMRNTRNATGVQMVGVFVANGIVPYADSEHVSKDRYAYDVCI